MRRSIAISFLLLWCLCYFWTSRVNAVDTDLSENLITGADAEKIIAAVNMTVADPDILEQSIVCFAVSENGKVAIGTGSSKNANIYLLDTSGELVCRYKFKCTGDFGVAFLKGDLAIYLCRSDVVIVYDELGKAKAVYKLPVNIINEVVDELLHKTQVEQGCTRYVLEREIGINMLEYSRLVRYSENGEKSILYDVTSQHNARTIFGYCGLGLFLTAWIVTMIRQAKDSKKE